MAVVETRDLTKVFKEGQLGAVNHVNLETREGEFLVFLGPSGSGKTTLLRMIAGLETPTSGEILIGGQVVNDLSPRERRIAMVFQSYALYPHLSVYKNIAFPLKAQNVKKELHKEKVEWAASLLGIGALLDRKPRELSGGERQRVALARAIVREPAVFLLDEPLSNLDAKLRASAREELERFHRRVGTTTIYVTHDQVEAMAMGDRVLVLNKGVVHQLGTPAEVYDNPADTFVATFLGSPPMNLAELGELGQVHRRGTEKSSDEGICGVVVDFGRRAELVDNAFIEHQDAVAHGHGFHLIVRDVDRRSADAAVKALELLARGGAQLGVKIRERLVEQEHGGLADDRAGKRNPLAFAAGELARLALEKCTYSEQRSRPLDFLLVELFFDLLSLQRKRYILVDRQVRVERVALEDHGDAAFARRKVVDHAAANEDIAGRGRFQSGDHAQ